MADETLARRYSAALYALAREAGSVETVVRELDAFTAALRSDPAVAEFFASPVVDRAQKSDVIARALGGGAGELVLGFLTLLVRKRREGLVHAVARQMHEMLDADAGRSTAQIATPTPLSPPELADLARRLSNVYKRTIVPQVKVEPDLLGGAVVQVGDRYLDASVAGKLETVRRHLLESADTAGATSPNGKGS